MSTASERWADTFWDLVDMATYRGVMLVAAMNNERKRTIPSEFAGVFSVACAPGTDRERIWCNPDGPAEWGAAGIDVDVAWMDGATIRTTGNSFAAPVVAGHLARILAAHPGIKPWQAKTVLAQLAVNAPRRPERGPETRRRGTDPAGRCPFVDQGVSCRDRDGLRPRRRGRRYGRDRRVLAGFLGLLEIDGGQVALGGVGVDVAVDFVVLGAHDPSPVSVWAAQPPC